MNKNQYKQKVTLADQDYTIFNIENVADDFGFSIYKLPYTLRVLLENVLRKDFKEDKISAFAQWVKDKRSDKVIDYFPSRILMQDFTGVPAIVDLASMRDILKKLGSDPRKINPSIPVDLVIDHSLKAEYSGSDKALGKNIELEIKENQERYEFLKWGQKNFSNFRVIPPGNGICHQVNLEYLAKVINSQKENGEIIAFPDSLIGTDSHTTMINALSVLGWGVGGIEAESAMLGESISMTIPEVIGVRLVGKIVDGTSATDIVLKITETLRKVDVVGKFVEFFGEALKYLSLTDRATISNMAPEYGATCGFFPIDSETLNYLALTGRSKTHIKFVEAYAKKQSLWELDSEKIEYSNLIEIDISQIKLSLAGPKRPQDLVELDKLPENFKQNFPVENIDKNSLNHGDIVIAAITSCTNTSNPYLMIAAGLIAKKASLLGLKPKSWVKTSLAPGSRVVSEYLRESGLQEYLDKIGFHVVGYGCTTCIGNSGSLANGIEKIIEDNSLVVCSILSGNRNFEGRIHPSVKANYIASPQLIIAYALAGTVNINLYTDPIAQDKNSREIYLKDIYPKDSEIREYLNKYVKTSIFTKKYENIFEGNQYWGNIKATKSNEYRWKDSTYIKNPPYFAETNETQNIRNARILAILGDAVTTDHISPAGTINPQSPAGKYLIKNGVDKGNFNSYGARRGNHEVMMRGTFANNRIKNLICPGTEGGITMNYVSGNVENIYDAAITYQKKSIPLVIFVGHNYGTGSSRDWAAKGVKLLGVRAVIAKSFERIHRSNLIGMGVLPIILESNIKPLIGNEIIDVKWSGDMTIKKKIECHITKDTQTLVIEGVVQIYTDKELSYIIYGGILNDVIRKII